MNNLKRNSDALLVLGMHRSGTSALTGALGLLGVQLSENLFAPQRGVNDKGFFEHGDIGDTHDDILLELASRWDDVLPLPDNWWSEPALAVHRARLLRIVRRDFAKARMWGIKDPRVCRLLPLWQTLLEQLPVQTHYLLALRHPLEVARSLQRRDGFSREKALLLWLDHNIEAERLSRGGNRALVTYDGLLQNPIVELQRIESELGIRFPNSVSSREGQLRDFLTADLRHHDESSVADATTVGQLADRLYRLLVDGTAGAGEVDLDAVDRVAAEVRDYRGSFPPLLLEQLELEKRDAAHWHRVFNRHYRSWWWIASKPVRALERLIRTERT